LAAPPHIAVTAGECGSPHGIGCGGPQAQCVPCGRHSVRAPVVPAELRRALIPDSKSGARGIHGLGHHDFASPDVIFYDDFDPQYRVARSAMGYGDIWTQPFTQLRSAQHGVIDGPEVITGADLATSTLEFAAALTAADGKVTGIRTRSTLVWRCSGSDWRIVREHNSSRVVPTREVQALLRAVPAQPAL
jgi:ketosteroid isomerase-like protein